MARAEELRDLAVQVAVEAAALVRQRRAEGVSVVATKSSAIDIVTAADTECEQFVRMRLHHARPGDGFIGEEGSADSSSTGITWVVDPIDGTVNFLYGIPAYAVSIAARDDTGVVAAAVVNAASGETFAAARGAGSTADGRSLRVRPTPPLEQRLIATGFWYTTELRALQARAVAVMLPLIRDIRRVGSSALDLCGLADGRCDGYVEEGPEPWDYSAGGLVATEAGARFELLAGAGGKDLVVCAPADGFSAFVELVTRAGFVALPGRE